MAQLSMRTNPTTFSNVVFLRSII